jgi:hypothetical protein
VLLARPTTVPERGEPIRSMSFPQVWKPHLGVMLDWNRLGDDSAVGPELAGGLYRDLGNPAYAALGLVGEGYVNRVEGVTDGGARLFLACPFFALQLGGDYSYQRDKIDFALSLTPAVSRGGPLGLGGHVRFDWIPSRNHSFRFGLSVPIGQRWMGRTRPDTDHVSLPRAPHAAPSVFDPDAELLHTLQRVEYAADWINRFTTPFFDQSDGTDESHIAGFLEAMARFKDHIALRDDVYPEGHSFPAEIAVYHRELERAFALAAGATGGGDAQADGRGARIARQARMVLLDEVILPYNRLLGQRKTDDSLLGLGARAEDVFAAWVSWSDDVPPVQRPAVMYVFRTLIRLFEENRKGAREVWGDSRLVWLPLRWALRPDECDSQRELDAILARAVEEEFTDANQVDYVINELFQRELARTIRAAEDYHVLWIHDYRGVNQIGKPDEVAYRQTVEVYLRALIERVERYEETRRMPVYMVFLDQFYFEANEGRLFLELLENPLERSVDLPAEFRDWEATIRAAQDELRAAVAASPSLQAGARHYGRDWLENLVKVHINITNPADVSFRSSHLMPLPFIPDIMLRDHRKIAFRDVTELDPGRGEAIYTGQGVGEHYAGPTWDDRGLVARGPALVSLKTAARELLLSQGFAEREIPLPLRPLPEPDDYDRRLGELRERGWVTRALQVHNATGYGSKPINVVKGVLYELMPAGSHLYIPDSLWNSAFWAGMLTGAALRGCWVFPIAPAIENAPSDGVPQMSRANEIFTRFVVIQNEMREEIEAMGGMLRTGIYSVDAAVGDGAAKARALRESWQTNAFLQEVFPFDAATREMVMGLEAEIAASGFEPVYYAQDVVDRRPKLHIKNQFFASGRAVATLVPRAEWLPLIREYMIAREKQIRVRQTGVDAQELRLELSGIARRLVDRWWQGLAPAERDEVVFYLTTGSQNQDYRGKIMDGEVMYVIAQVQAMIGYLDFVMMMSLSTWVEDVDQLNELLPLQGGLSRRLGRFIKNAL